MTFSTFSVYVGTTKHRKATDVSATSRPRSTAGIVIAHCEIPHARHAVSSLSADSRPYTIVVANSAATGNEYVVIAGEKYERILATWDTSSPCCVSGRRSAPNDMIPASAPDASRKMRSRSLRRYQKSVLLMRVRVCYRWGVKIQTSPFPLSCTRGEGRGEGIQHLASTAAVTSVTLPHMALGAIVHGLLDLCFPWTCAVCQTPYEGAGPLCPACSDRLTDLEHDPHCPACAAPLPMEHSPCPYCMGKGPPNFYRVVRLAPYADPLREMILHLKYHRKWGLGEDLANRLLAREDVKELLQDTAREAGVLVPVPLHWKRHFLRWYNQAEVVAR